jgi:citrate synthase
VEGDYTEPVTEFSPGLEGVLAARTSISLVDGQNGRLVYRGYDIADLAEKATFEEIAYLLWHGELPDEDEVHGLHQGLAERRRLSAAAEATLRGMPGESGPMDVLRTVLSAQGVGPRLVKPDLEQAISVTAVLPTILAGFNRQRRGLAALEPRADLGQAANYLYMLTGEEPRPEHARALDTYFVLLADHGMNASTFAARVIASTDSDLVSSLTGAIGALKGPAHGGAPSLVIDQLEKIGTPEKAESWLRGALERKERFMGFGHRVYRTYDPRARILKEMARRLNPPFFALASRVEEVALRLLTERHPERPQATNVEFYSAGVLQAVGLPKDMFPPTFAASRAAGWSAHVLEQAAHNRLIRPASDYVGPALRKPIPLAQRGRSAQTAQANNLRFDPIGPRD